MSDIVLKVENASKKFCRTFKNLVKYGSYDILRDFVGIRTDTGKLRSGEFWAVKNVSFELHRGESLGVIGINGSGKTTLLKMVNGIFMPDEGRIFSRGTMGALIAVGVGFHPMLTGRENIYVNGQMVGMTKREIDGKLDKIIEFAEIEDSIDAPVKHYSSGMLVRLGFSVAVHSIPDILLIDEVLAVGDTAFRKKCLDRIEDIKNRVSSIYVSHNMLQVERLCDRAILLDHGEIVAAGDPPDVIKHYYNLTAEKQVGRKAPALTVHSTDSIIRDIDIDISGSDNSEDQLIDLQKETTFRFSFFSEEEVEDPVFGVTIETQEGYIIGTILSYNDECHVKKIKKGANEITLRTINLNLAPGTYRTGLTIKTQIGATLMAATGRYFAVKSDEKNPPVPGVVRFNGIWTAR